MRHHRRNQRPNQSKQVQEVKDNFVRLDFGTHICPLCGNVITDMTTAIAFGPQAAPAHLDCVIIHLRKHEALNKDEDIVYVGCGQFAVASLRPRFTILRRIPVENKDVVPEWRKNMKQIFMKSFVT